MNQRRIGSFILATSLAAAMTPSACGADGTVKLTMDDLPPQPVHGLVHPTGVQFGFTIGGISSLDARYNDFGPGSIGTVQDPSIEGDAAGVLSITFPLPTPIVRFGVARSIDTVLPNGVAVELFDPTNGSLGVSSLTLIPTTNFAEVHFEYTGSPAKRAAVRFPTTLAFNRFAFDNLEFLVPEPTTCILAGIASVAAVGGRVRRRRR